MVSRGVTQVVVLAVTAVLALGAFAVSSEAQAPTVKPEDVVGTWEGVSKGTNGEVPVKVDILLTAGKFTGAIGTPGMVVSIVDGKLEGDTLTLTIDAQGMGGVMSGKVSSGKIEGTWQVGSESGAVVITKGAAAAPAAPGADSLTGEWNGEAMVQGQPMPIALFLKVEGETVSGEMQSAMGRVPLTSGSWKDGVLTLAFPYAGGEPVTMGGKLQDGKLGGVFDYNSGEAQGTWWAARK